MTARRAARRQEAPARVTISTPLHPHLGHRVRHRTDGRTGTITGQLVEHLSLSDTVWRRRVFIRPLGGGIEFEADPTDLELL
ncbi:hypothetical protein [Streptacidiphilus sp. EB129]|uniref:hypothetical protein n=1 Tax=Streptacidiphilus sp. EB129 TaxID=3156262 RepID=UPI0035128345